MKKIMRIMAMAVVAVAMAAGFASCSKDDGANGLIPEKSYYPSLKFDLKVSEDALSIADFSVTYLDENGQEKTEAFNTTSFSKTIKFNSLPAKVKYSVNYKMKSTIPDKEKFDLSVYDNSKAGKSDGTNFYSALKLSSLSQNGKGIKKENIATDFGRYYDNWSNEGTIEK